MSQPYMGTNFQWFVGVVEDRQDPLMLGRIRVRALGWYTEDKTKVPTSALPWAYPMQSITSAAMSGVGHTPMGPVEGTWVVGFFKDGSHAQEPVILGTLGGIPGKQDTQTGFSDPSGAYPRYTNEPDTNRRGRNENVSKRSNRASTTSAFGASWSEPADPYAAIYPKNHIYESESGHQQEYDDTPGAERTFRKHRTGTFEEIHPSGSRVHKVVNDNYTIIASDDNVLVRGVCNITVENTCNMKVKEFNLEVENDWNIKVGGDKNETISGTLNQTVSGDVNEKYGSNQNTNVSNTLNVDAKRIDVDATYISVDAVYMTSSDMDFRVDGSMSVDVRGNKTENYRSNRTSSVRGSRTHSVGGSSSDNVTGSLSQSIGGNRTSSIGGNATDSISGDLATNVSGNSSLSASRVDIN